MKKLLMLLAVALGVSSLFAYEFQFTDDKGYTWLLEKCSSDEPVAGSGEYVSQWWIDGVTPSPTGDFEIPAKLGGKAVYGIGFESFSGVNGLTNLTIAAGIRAISNGAFRDAANLTKVTIKGELDWVEDDAFDGTKFLENAETGHQALVLGGHLYRYFSTNETYTVPAGVKAIDDGAFSTAPTNSEGKAFLKKITFNDGLEEIGENAFDGVAVFEFDELVLPDSVDWIGRAAFGRCTIKSLKLGAGMTNITDFKEWFESDFDDDDIEPSADTPRFGLGGDSFGTATELTGACGRAGGDVNDDSTLFWRWVAPFTGRVAFSTKDSTEKDGSASDTELYVYDPSDFLFPIVFDDDYDGYSPDCTSKVTFDVTQGSTYYIKFFYWGGSPSNAVMRWQAVKKPEGRDGLESIDFGGATEIPAYLFYDSENPFTNLKSVTFGPGAREIGRMAFYGCTGLTNVTFGAGLRTIGDQAFKGTGLMSVDLSAATMLMVIGDSVFADCPDLASVAFNEGLLQIGYSAFSGCPKLAKLVFPKTLLVIERYAFAHCTNLSEIVLNDGLKNIDGCAFWNESFYGEYNEVLKKVNIPSSVLSLGDDVFGSCTNLAEITGCEGLVIAGVGSFGEGVPAAKQWYCGEFDPESGKKLDFKVVTLGKTVLGFQGECPAKLEAKDFGEAIAISDHAFACRRDYDWTDPDEYNLSVSNLTSVTFPESLKLIGDGAFIGACNLTELKFAGDSSEVMVGSESFMQTGFKELTGTFGSLDAGAFAECPDLTDVNITTADFRDRIFAGCTALTNVDIAASFTYVYLTSSEDSPFADCENLISAKIDFGDCEIEGEGSYFFGNCMALRTVSFNARTIPDGLFNGKPALESCQIGTNVTKIGIAAFHNRSGLTDLVIPDGVVAIGERAFMGCSGLTNLTGCAGVAFVDEQAFEGCTALFGDQTNGAFVVNGILASYSDVPGVTKAVIPEGVRVVASGSFVGCEEVSEIEFPESVEYIPGGTARGCKYLKTVVCKNPDILFVDNPEWNSEALFGDWVEVIVKKASQRAYAFEWTSDEVYGDCYIAAFEKLAFHSDASADGDFVPGSSYTGWLMSGGYVVGTVTVKTGKLDKNGEVKVTATVQLAGVKKNVTAMFKVDENGKAVATEAAKNQYSELAGVFLGGTWLSGGVRLANQDYTIRGANSSKEALDGMDAFANHTWGAVLTSSSDLAPVVNGYSGLSIAVAKKGKVKISGTLADGQKVSVTAQMAAGDNGVFAAPVYVQTNGKKGGFGFVLYFCLDGETPCAWFEKNYDQAVGDMTKWQYPLEFGVSSGSNASTLTWIGLSPVGGGEELFEIDPKGNGLAEGTHLVSTWKGYTSAAAQAMFAAAKSPYVICDDEDGLPVELTVDAKGKWTCPKDMKVTLATANDLKKYQDDIANEFKHHDFSYDYCCFMTSDGKILDAYAFDEDELLGTYTPTGWLLYDIGSKVKGGEVIVGNNMNFEGLKLSYAKKTGLVSGSTVYYWVDISKADKPTLKKGKNTISGIVIDGMIYGASTTKKVASCKVTSEKVED